ncbi:hypothetical protein BJ742DRAFT_268973 [Cladochytrium replicatum]|nr:hypothetical protein BJ742DRAFT_268973 [Cladochytrium replicatum]
MSNLIPTSVLNLFGSSGPTTASVSSAAAAAASGAADTAVDMMGSMTESLSYAFNYGLSATISRVTGQALDMLVYEHGVVLVTGCSSGTVAWNTAKSLAAAGYTVFAGVHTKEAAGRIIAKYSRRRTVSSKASLEWIDGRAPPGPTAGTATPLAAKKQHPSIIIPVILEVTKPDNINRAAEAVRDFLDDPVHYCEALDLRLPTPYNILLANQKRRSSVADENAVEASNVQLPKLYMVGIVNCESVGSFGPLELLPTTDLLRTYEVNAVGAIEVVKAFLPFLRESRGRIVNVSSSAGMTAAPVLGSYAASKVALEALSDSLRIELGKWGISVSIIEPGSNDANVYSKKVTSKPTISTTAPSAQTQSDTFLKSRTRLEGTTSTAPGDSSAAPYTTPPHSPATTSTAFFQEDVAEAYAPLIQTVQSVARDTRRYVGAQQRRKDPAAASGSSKSGEKSSYSASKAPVTDPILDSATRAIIHALTSKYPMTRYLCGLDARATALMRWVLPDRLLDLGFQAMVGEREMQRQRELEEQEQLFAEIRAERAARRRNSVDSIPGSAANKNRWSIAEMEDQVVVVDQEQELAMEPIDEEEEPEGAALAATASTPDGESWKTHVRRHSE